MLPSATEIEVLSRDPVVWVACAGFLFVTWLVFRICRLSRDRINAIKELALFVDQANAPIFGVDRQGLINEWNSQAERLTGFSKAEVMGQHLVRKCITVEFRSSVDKVIQAALNGSETANFEFPLYTKSGRALDILMNSTTRRSTGGEIIGVIGVGQDITQIKKSHLQLIQASKLTTLGEMATAVAHELNQPLTTISMATDNIATSIELGRFTKESVGRKLDRINDQIARATSIINHLRMFGRKPLGISVCIAAEQVVGGAVDLMGEQLRLADIELAVDDLSNCPSFSGDQIQVEQVLINLMCNARDALLLNSDSPLKRIDIGWANIADDKLELTVSDTGGGIVPELLPRIFEPFFTTKAIGKGTGLGLSVSYGIVRDMGGQLKVQNIPGGARFSIQVPALS